MNEVIKTLSLRSVKLPAKTVAYGLCFIPLVYLSYLVLAQKMGANPVERLIHFTGDWAIGLLAGSLTISPLVHFLKKPKLMFLRKILGLCAFYYAMLHFIFYMTFEVSYSMQALTKDIVKRPYITFGFLSLCILSVLAATSGANKLGLTFKVWKRIHRFVYLGAILSILHYIWLVKADHLLPLIYAVILTALLFSRVVIYFDKRRK